jgi:UDPglucose--hexose-1-phosphate uridylyltransferase
MPELRQDPLSRRWVIIGEDRAARPNDFVSTISRRADLACPFCLGNEQETPHEIAVYKAQDACEAWTVRVVPNKYPAVMNGAAPMQPIGPVQPWFQAPVARGSHEVIIESARHVASFAELTDAEALLAFTAYRDRLAQLAANPQYKYAQIFKNVGPSAGASLEHTHSQLLALPWVPPHIQEELDSCRQHYLDRQQCLLCQLAEEEASAGVRLVAETERFVAFCPFASRVPFETLVLPRAHADRFETATTGELRELATLIRDLIGCIESAGGISAYNYWIHSSPFDMPARDHYHWHIEILPCSTKLAGFEWGTGCFINPLPPESAAEILRGAKVR